MQTVFRFLAYLPSFLLYFKLNLAKKLNKNIALPILGVLSPK